MRNINIIILDISNILSLIGYSSSSVVTFLPSELMNKSKQSKSRALLFDYNSWLRAKRELDFWRLIRYIFVIFDALQDAIFFQDPQYYIDGYVGYARPSA
jgi:hypothetical protein